MGLKRPDVLQMKQGRYYQAVVNDDTPKDEILHTSWPVIQDLKVAN